MKILQKKAKNFLLRAVKIDLLFVKFIKFIEVFLNEIGASQPASTNLH